MLRLIQRFQITRGAKLINRVNELYKKGEVRKADRLKKKLPIGVHEKMYWMINESITLRVREGK